MLFPSERFSSRHTGESRYPALAIASLRGQQSFRLKHRLLFMPRRRASLDTGFRRYDDKQNQTFITRTRQLPEAKVTPAPVELLNRIIAEFAALT